MTEKRLYIVGVTPRGLESLSGKAKHLIAHADILFGGQRLLDLFPENASVKIGIGGNLSECLDVIAENLGEKNLVVLASGDPGFFGIARYLVDEFGKDSIDIIPNVSSVQTAFARIGEGWQDTVFASTHGRDIDTVIPVIAASEKIALLTDERSGPGEIARLMLNRGLTGYKAIVCQDLDMASERIEPYKLHELPGRAFSALTVLILIKESRDKTITIGIDDEQFSQRKPREGLITKQEIRAISLAKLRLTDSSTVWDIGAGSGSVSIEASILSPKGRIFAVEKNHADVENIRQNIRKFERHNIEVIETIAPDGLAGLPVPDAVFIGGNAGNMELIIRLVSKIVNPGGRIVINAATFETLQASISILNDCSFPPDITLVNIARSVGVLDLTRLQSLNPVFVISATVPNKESAV